VTPQSHWVLPLSYCACAPGASAFGTLSGRSRLIARPPLILATFVASALLAWKCSQSTFACGLRARRQPPRTRALNVPRRASTNIGNRAFSKASIKPRHRSGATIRFLCQTFFFAKEKPSGRSSTEFFAKLFFKKASSKPRHRSGATVRFLCPAFFLAKESGCIIPCSSIYRRSVCLRGGTLRFPPLKLPTLKGLPVTVAGHWVLPLSYCACAPGASAFGTLSGRSRLIARPPLILATFVASALLAWKCSQSTFACGLRARRQPPRTRALNVPRRASKRKTPWMLLH